MRPNTPALTVRHVLITGGSRGIGLAIAQLFAKNAYRCTLIARSEGPLEKALKTLPNYHYQRCDIPHRYIVGDVASPKFWTEHEIATQLKLSQITRREKDKTSSRKEGRGEAGAEEKKEDVEEGDSADLLRKALEPMGREDTEVEGQETSLWSAKGDESTGKTTQSETTNAPESIAETSAEPSPDSKTNLGNDKDHIDVLVNCAGITQSSLFSRTPRADIQRIMDTNLTGMMQGTQYMLRYGYFTRKGKEQDFSPVIINVSSLLGLHRGFGAVAYSASKAGVLGFTRALASESAAHGIRVNAIVPGYIETDMTADLDHSRLSLGIPLKRFGKPEEIADAALFLVKNQYAHNCVINLDGGLSAM